MGVYVKRQDINKSSLWKDSGPLLGHLDMELTERCNNNCLHCFINLPADDLNTIKKELSLDEIKEILKEAVALGCLNVRFTGGEPLIREDFEEIYLFARRAGLRVILFTNATLITPKIAELFSRIPPLEKIEITVYGMKQDSYEAVTRKDGSFVAAWRGINLLIKNKIPFVVKGALLPSNKNEIEEFDAWAKTIPGMNSPVSYAMFFTLHGRRNREKNRLIERIRPPIKEGLKVHARYKDRYFNEMREFCAKFTRPDGDELFSCGSGIGQGCVDAYGYFQPCLMLRHPDTVYNLKKGTLKDALLNFFPQLRKLKATNPDYLIRCAQCFLRGFCGQCPAKSWMEDGTLDTPVEYLCNVAHTQARFLGLVKDTEKAWEVRDWKERIETFTSKKRR